MRKKLAFALVAIIILSVFSPMLIWATADIPIPPPPPPPSPPPPSQRPPLPPPTQPPPYISPPHPASLPDGVAGVYYATDIATYLRGAPANSINIGGKTLIDAEAMQHYGFDVTWRDDQRLLEIVDTQNPELSPKALDGSLLGIELEKTDLHPFMQLLNMTSPWYYYYTDIVTTLNSVEIESFNIDGRTFIGAEAMRDFGYSVIWSEVERALSIDMAKPYQWPVVEDAYFRVRDADGGASGNFNASIDGFVVVFDRDLNALEATRMVFHLAGTNISKGWQMVQAGFNGRLVLDGDKVLSHFDQSTADAEELSSPGEYVLNIVYRNALHYGIDRITID